MTLAKLPDETVRKPSPERDQKDRGEEGRRAPEACPRDGDTSHSYEVNKKPGEEDVDRIDEAKVADHQAPDRFAA